MSTLARRRGARGRGPAGRGVRRPGRDRHDPRRGRRDRDPGLGRDAPADVPRWAERAGFEAEVDDYQTATRPASSRPRSPSRRRTPTACCGRAGIHRLVRIPRSTTKAAPHLVRGARRHPGARDEEEHRDRPDDELRIDIYRSSRPGRAAGEHHRLGGPHHPPPDRDRGGLPERALPAPEQGHRHEDPEGPAARTRAQEREARDARRCAATPGHRLRQPDPQLRPPPLPDGQGPPDERGDGNIQAVLDGDLDQFVAAELRRRATTP